MRFIIILASFLAILTFSALILKTPNTIASDFDSETITVFAEDCATQKTSFSLGDSVCARQTGSPLGPPVQRRFEWIAPDGTIFQLGPDVVSDFQSNSITLPTSGPAALVGTWTVKTIDASNNGFGVAQFIVHDANKVAADLSVNMFVPFQAAAGANLTFTLLVKNNGPNEARNVELKIGAASNATLLAAEQTAGPRFAWPVEPQGASQPGLCSIPTLPINAQASFTFVYQIEPAASNGTSITSAAQISSSTFELYPNDNLASATSNITPQPCALACPSAITVPKQQGQCGALVRFDQPAQAGSNCGALICNPASGSFFPTGTTTVTCVGNTGTPCNFTVVVDDPQPPALDCPSDITVTESAPGMGLCVVKYKSPVTNENCSVQSSACVPPSGSSFPLGATVVKCETANASGERAACSFTVTVESSNCSVICPSGIARSAKPGQCGAIITYPAPKTEGNCGAVTCSPPSGAFFPVGTMNVSCSSKSGSNASFEITVQDTESPVVTGITASPAVLPAPDRKMRDVTIGYDSSDNCAGDVTCSLRVSSNEPASGASAAKPSPDWEIVDPHHVRLRADRSDKIKDRIYTITITCADSSGNSAERIVTVRVPGNRQ